MLRFLARVWARQLYIFKEETTAFTNELNSKAATWRVAQAREAAQQLRKEADGIDATIKAVEEKLAQGFWECEAGHEIYNDKADALADRVSCECGKPVTFVKRDAMSGQEQYESDKERKEAEQIAADKRAQADNLEKPLADFESAAKSLMKQAAQSREFAELLRKL